MKLDRLKLFDFRNYETLDASFVPGVNLLVGENAQGKTNLLEAIFYLSAAKSFRTAHPQEMIRFGAEFFDVQAEISSQQRQQSLRAVVFAEKRPRQLFVGGVRQRSAAALSGLLPCVLFCPEELQVLKNGAQGRRRLLDNALCQLRPVYADTLAEYHRLLEQKTRILKDQIPSMLDTLPDFNLRMAQTGAVLIEYRANYLRDLEKEAQQYHREFSGGKERLHLAYQTVKTVTDPFASRDTILQQLLQHQKAHERAELESGQCLSGPHKDDFDASLDEKSIKNYASQGQTRTASISLKLAERALLRRDYGEEPLLLLDDVLSELDAKRQDFVLNQIRTGQVFITCCETDRLTALGKTVFVKNGQIAEG